MAATSDRDQVLGDYAAFIRALLPQAQGFVCHDRHGRVFWHDAPAAGMPPVTDEYRERLTGLLAGKLVADDGARVALGRYFAYLVRLADDDQHCLGVLAVLVDRADAALPYAFAVDLMAPAWRSLQRELALRFRVVTGQRKLEVQAAEERFLHHVEKIVHQQQACDAVLATILGLCCEHLGVGGAFLILPDKGLTLAHGQVPERHALVLLGQDLLAAARSPGFEPGRMQRRPDELWVAINPHGQDTEGVLALCGWRQSEFSQRRLARVLRYIASHVAAVLDRNYDVLTGLMAWPLLQAQIAAAADSEAHAILALDIDGLHVVNDTFGHEAGDDVLRKLAALLREVVPGQTASRVTGDSFAVLLCNTSTARARLLAEDVCARFREHVYQRADSTYRPTVSVGIAALTGANAADDGFAAAQVACKTAKDRGRGRVEVYESADASIVRRVDDIQIVGYVRSAIEHDRLALVAQPLMPLRPGRVAHYHEVLVRIVDERGQHVAPGEFMSAAERYQLMEDLDRWVVATTLRTLEQRGTHLRSGDARFAINLSGQSLGSDGFLAFVEHSIRGSGVPPDVIAFEITESVAVARMQQAQTFMQTLKRLGCRFSLDDFGTGLSSFGYLKVFPVDTLKIDGSFVRDITTNVVSQSVVAAIAEVARVMQLETVAEYVQDQAAIDLLRNLNISYAQGFFVGRTDPLEDAITTIDTAVVSGLKLPLPSTS